MLFENENVGFRYMFDWNFNKNNYSFLMFSYVLIILYKKI